MTLLFPANLFPPFLKSDRGCFDQTRLVCISISLSLLIELLSSCLAGRGLLYLLTCILLPDYTGYHLAELSMRLVQWTPIFIVNPYSKNTYNIGGGIEHNVQLILNISNLISRLKYLKILHQNLH